MKSYRSVFLVLIWIILLFLAPGTLAKLVCGDNLSGGTSILQLSSTSNAHGEEGGEPNYTQAIGGIEIRCKEDAGVTINTGLSNPVNLIRISSNTNAHAQQTGYAGTPYPTNVQIGHSGGSGAGKILVGVAGIPFTPATCADMSTATAIYTEVVRISDESNAHLQSPSFTGTKYPVIICAAYDDTGGGGPGGFTDKDIIGASFNPTGTTLASAIPYIEEGQSITLPTFIDNLPKKLNYPDSNYSNIGTGWVAAICNRDIDPTGTGIRCDEINTIQKLYVDFFTPGNTIIGPSIMVENYATNDSKLNGYTNQGPIDADATITKNYPIDTANGTSLGDALNPGHYRFLLMELPGNYTWVPDSSTHVELPEFLVSPYAPNFAYLDFEITTDGPPDGETGAGNGGDIYVIKNIDFPNIYRNGTDTILANVTIQDLRTDLTTNNPPGTPLKIIIRDSKGATVGAFTPASYEIGNYSASGDTYTVPVEIDPVVSPYLTIGETYTLYAKVEPYVENPVVDLDDSESVIGNNSAFKTFTVLNPPQTVNVPDAPWWMSLVVACVVMGWLFLSTRNEKGKGNSGRKGKFALNE